MHDSATPINRTLSTMRGRYVTGSRPGFARWTTERSEQYNIGITNKYIRVCLCDRDRRLDTWIDFNEILQIQ